MLTHRILVFMLVAVMSVVLTTGVVLAAFATTSLTSTGQITVVSPPQPPAPPQPPPPSTDSYTVSATVLSFGDTTVQTGGAISVLSYPITVTNTGTTSIANIVVNIDPASVPVGLTATPSIVGTFPLAINGTATVTVTLTGAASPTPTIIDLAGITATLQPS